MSTFLKVLRILVFGIIIRWLVAGLTAWYRDGDVRMEGERVARWDVRDRVERYWSVMFYALLLLWGAAVDLTITAIPDEFWARAAGIVILTLLGVFVSVITARRIVVAVTHDPWTVQEMWVDRVHLYILLLVAIVTPVVMLSPQDADWILPQEAITAGFPILTGVIAGAWAASVILVDHRSKRLLLSSVKAAFGGSDAEWSRSRFVARGKVVTIRHAPASAFSDLRASEGKLAQVAPDWQIDGDENHTSAAASRLTLIRTTDETHDSRAIIKRSEGLIVKVSPGFTPDSLRYDLAPGTGMSAYPRVDAIAKGDSLRVIEWNPAASYATVAPLDHATATLRDAAAEYLRVQPYDIELTTTTDDRARVTGVTISRFPKTEVDGDKREESWLAILDAESTRDENEVWLLDSGDGAMIWNLRTDPLAGIQPYPWDAPISMGSIPFAVDAAGAPVCLKIYESNILVGGIPGSGKSGGSTAILAGVARLENTALYGIDLKRVELTPWLPRFEEIAKTAEDSLDLLKRLHVEMMARYEYLEEHGLKKLSPATFSPERPLIALIIDELAQLVLSGDKLMSDEIKELLRSLVALGRAAGITVITMTQKPETAVIPSSFRDLLAQRVAFATTTRQMTDTVLGDGVGANGGDAHLIPQSLKGVNFLTNEESREPRRTRAYWVPDEEVAGVAERTAHLRVGVTLAVEEDENAIPAPDFGDDEDFTTVGSEVAVEAPLGDEFEFTFDAPDDDIFVVPE